MVEKPTAATSTPLIVKWYERPWKCSVPPPQVAPTPISAAFSEISTVASGGPFLPGSVAARTGADSTTARDRLDRRAAIRIGEDPSR